MATHSPIKLVHEFGGVVLVLTPNVTPDDDRDWMFQHPKLFEQRARRIRGVVRGYIVGVGRRTRLVSGYVLGSFQLTPFEGGLVFAIVDKEALRGLLQCRDFQTRVERQALRPFSGRSGGRCIAVRDPKSAGT